MTPRALDIFLAPFILRQCTDVRPCIVLCQLDADSFEIAAITSQLELCHSQTHFRIEKGHPDFNATGLTKNSYVLERAIRQIKATSFCKRLGRLEGSLAREFTDWYGL
jgi:mRNA-degrading endonuclease toxin of MazEF toxin-antitoxin module